MIMCIMTDTFVVVVVVVSLSMPGTVGQGMCIEVRLECGLLHFSQLNVAVVSQHYA